MASGVRVNLNVRTAAAACSAFITRDSGGRDLQYPTLHLFDQGYQGGGAGGGHGDALEPAACLPGCFRIDQVLFVEDPDHGNVL